MRESSSVARAPTVSLPPRAVPDDGSAGGSPADAPAMALRLTEDHDRIPEGLNDVVVHRLFSAGLALEAALALIGTHPAAGKIAHAIGELDQAVIDLRTAVFARPRPDLPGPAGPG
jgi:hypothetical protein